METSATYTSFAGLTLLSSGDLRTMLLATKTYLDGEAAEPVLIFEDQTGQQVDFDFRGTAEEVLRRYEPAAKPAPGPGRPKLGVVPREVTLLPRHWEWLERQPSGISAALRRLVEEAMKRNPGEEQTRRVREAASRFLWSMAGNLPNFEETTRALFAGDQSRLEELTSDWPTDVRRHLFKMLAPA